MVETGDAGRRKPTSGAGQRTGAASSQQVDDVGEEDEANDGEEHQHQNVHHDGDAAGGDGRCGRAEDTQGKKKTPQQPGSEEIGKDRLRSGDDEARRGEAAPPPSPPPVLVVNRK